MNAAVILPDPVLAFLAREGWARDCVVEALPAGIRHRLFRLTSPAGAAALKLHAPARPGDADAFAREWTMHRLLAEHCPNRVPLLLAADNSARSLLWQWVPGRRGQPGELDDAALRHMAAFLAEMNAPALQLAATKAGAPPAAEAAWDLPGHAARAHRRLTRLLAVTGGGAAARMRAFVGDELVPAWERLAASTAPATGAATTRVLSPSDFGWHNTLITPDGSLRFLDFEHAGWDDPAKLAADFILQPDRPLDAPEARSWLEELGATGRFPSDLPSRVARLLPLQHLKWTTIILNPFHAAEHPSEPDVALLAARLEKARRYWQRPIPVLACA